MQGERTQPATVNRDRHDRRRRSLHRRATPEPSLDGKPEPAADMRPALVLPASHFRRLYGALLLADAALLAANVLLALGVRSSATVVNRQLDLTLETNLGAWYSSALLLLAGVAAAVNGWLALLTEGGAGRRMRIGAWLLVAGLLTLLAADEVALLHEWAGNRLPRHAGAGEESLGVPGGFRWLLVLAPFLAGGAALLVWFAFRCLRGGPRLLVLAGVACWGGALAAEYVESQLWPDGHGRGLQAPLEEGLEVLGSTLLLIALIEALRRTLAGALAGPDERRPKTA